MKVKLPGLGGIQGLALAHGEKVVIAIVAACFVWMVFKSLSRESLPDDRQAANLQSAISAASSEIQQFSWETAVKEFPDDVRLPKPLEQKGEKFVDIGDYLAPNWTFGRNPPVVPPIVRRSDPVLLAVADVEANGQSGLLAFTNDAIRQQRLLAQQLKLQQEQQKQQQQQQRAAEEQPGRNRRDRNAGVDDGRGLVDPEHPDRRPLGGGIGSALGVPLAGDEEVRVAYWAVVVAKVPIKEQMKLYEDAFANALGYSPQSDFPQYLGYFVERAEAQPDVADKDLAWEKVTVYNGKGQPFGPVVTTKVLFGQEQQVGAGAAAKPASAVTSDWVGGTPEVVDPRYLDPSGTLTFPLPPLTGRNWGREVTHSEIPLAEDAVELESEAVPEDAAAPAEEDEDAFAGGVAGPGGGRQPGFGGGGRSFGGPGRGGRSFGGEYGGGEMGMGMGMRGGAGFAGGPRGGMGAEGVPQVPHWLLRFFDFSVQPGKKYKYRVRMALLDPNQSSGARFVDVDWLDSDALDRVKSAKATRGSKTPVRMTEWSEPSRTVSIPLAGNVSVASARPPVEQSFTDEPRAGLLVESFSADDKGKAIQGAKQFDDFRRGYVANRKSETEVILNEDGQQFIDKIKDFQFRTGITVVDIRGGERLAGRDNSRPGRVLLMDPAGQLFVQKELDDKDAVEMHEAIFSEDADGGRGFMGGRGGDFGGEFGGPGGAFQGRGGR